ncbi:hypothetical protein V3C99_004045, partial [Haemonchus contortus]|uniref:Fibrinogen C-terminal domain-containing protein n=1 Tax=Haemonchus contortus TaxID=6289 RepID=A0A7I4XXD1_HAECO
DESDSADGCIVSSFEKGNWSTENCDEKKCFVCETRVAMSDCTDWLKAGYKDDGMYSIVVNGTPHRVYCDMHTAGGGWVVFQRRVDGNDPFWNHNWTEYRNGFGNIGLDSNFWLGNEALHQLTHKDWDVTLRVEMRGDRTPNARNPNGYWWNHYSKFKVGSEKTHYKLEGLYIDWKNREGNASTGWWVTVVMKDH